MFKPEFVTTNRVTYQLVGIRGDEFADRERTTLNISVEGTRRGYPQPPAEAAALICEKFTLKELGYTYVVVCHKPIRDSNGYPGLLVLGRHDTDGWLGAWDVDPVLGLDREDLFLFLAPPPQVSAT